jgi:hypothetical protein
VVGTLLSATVSRLLVCALTPLVLEREGVSGTCVAAGVSGLELAASRFKEVFEGVLFSPSLLLDDCNLFEGSEGGGDFNRGDVGHDGELLPERAVLSLRTPFMVPSVPGDGIIGR